MFCKTVALTISGESREGTCSFSKMLEKFIKCNAFGWTLCFGGSKVKRTCNLKAIWLTQNTKYTLHVYQSVEDMSLSVW